MDNFLIYDIIFLVSFLVFFSVFLYTRKKGIKKEGLLLLYRTQWGIKLINKVGNKYKKTLKFMSYVSIATGYLLMIGVFYLVYTIVKIYFFSPAVVRAIKVPPILPLVPYLPQVFNLDFLPPFYFTYWIVILAVIAVSHEFAHGIFAAYNKVKIKTTGFGFFPHFLPIFLAAFVELDERVMAKKEKFKQMAILSAGTFANVIVAILFFIVIWIFFSAAFVPSGVVFDSYATSQITIAGITAVNGIAVNNASYDRIIELSNASGFNEIEANGKDYLSTKQILENQIESGGTLFVYNSAPAIKQNLTSIITEINGVPVTNLQELVNELSEYSPGETITVTTLEEEGPMETSIFLEEHPERPGEVWLGIGFFNQERSGIFGSIIDTLSSFKKPNIHYEPKFGGISVFFYNLIWWMVLISISVALINMLPVGIFDGGRFFYLTILGLTKSEKTAKRAFVISTQFFLLILFLLLVFWAISWI
jgi:membrane-associated protease RseP (regulator of RpoE activity)